MGSTNWTACSGRSAAKWRKVVRVMSNLPQFYTQPLLSLHLLLRFVLQTEHLEQATKLDFRQRSVISAASWTKKMRLMKWLNSFSRSCILWGHAHILKIALECQSCPRNFVSWLFVICCGWFSVTSESLYWKRERATQLLENQSGGISCRVPLSLVRLHRLWCMKLYH